MTGSLLGDGSIVGRHSGKTFRFTKTACLRNKEYLLWHQEELRPHGIESLSFRESGPVRIGPHLGHSSGSFAYNTHTTERFDVWRHDWYPNGKKIVPASLSLTPLALAVWYADDGCNAPKTRNAILCTNCFAFAEVDRLIALLAMTFGVRAVMGKAHGNRPIIRIHSSSYLDFLDVVRPHFVWDCFQYKISLDGYVAPRAKTGSGSWMAKFSDDQILQAKNLFAAGHTRAQIRDLTGISISQQLNYAKGRRGHPQAALWSREAAQRKRFKCPLKDK